MDNKDQEVLSAFEDLWWKSFDREGERCEDEYQKLVSFFLEQLKKREEEVRREIASDVEKAIDLKIKLYDFPSEHPKVGWILEGLESAKFSIKNIIEKRV